MYLTVTGRNQDIQGYHKTLYMFLKFQFLPVFIRLLSDDFFCVYVLILENFHAQHYWPKSQR